MRRSSILGVSALVWWLACIALLILAAALRLHLLGAQSFWNDEGNSYVQATRTVTEIAYHAGRDIHPPGYYWLLAGWRALTGDTEFALRAFSTFVSLITVAFAWTLGVRLYGRAAGVSAAVFVTLNTFSIYYAQEARMYALLALWSAASVWALIGLLKTGEHIHAEAGRLRRFAIMLAVFNAAGLYTQYSFVYVMLAQGILALLWLLGWTAKKNRAMMPFLLYVLANLLTIALFLPWLPTALQQITTWPNTGEVTPLMEAISVILNWLIVGITAQNASLAVAWLLLLFGLINRPRAGWWTLLVPVVWAVVSVSVFLAQGLFRENNLKFLLPAQIALSLWMGRGVWVLWNLDLSLTGDRRLGLMKYVPKVASLAGCVSLVSLLWAGIDPLYRDPVYQRADYRSMAAVIMAEARAGDVVILNGAGQAEVFNYYYQGDAEVFGLPAGLGGNDDTTRSEIEQVVANAARQGDVPFRKVFALFWGERERDPNRVVETVLDTMTYSVGDQWYGDVRLARWVQPVAVDEVQDVSLDVRFEDGTNTGITLVAAQVMAEQRPGGYVSVRLHWLNASDDPIVSRYKVFVQLLYPDGSLAAQHDGEPRGDLSPTTAWQLGMQVDDRHALQIPEESPSGEYTLIAGMYRLDAPNARLRLDQGADYVELARITLR